MEHAPSFEVDRCHCEIEGPGVASQASIARAGEAMDVFYERKQGLDRGAAMRDQLIAARLPWSCRTPPMTAMGNAITNAQRPEPHPPCVAVVSFVGIDRFLVSADQPVGRHGLIDVARSEDGAPDNAAALIHRDMRLVAEEVPAFLLRPGRIGIKQAPHQLTSGRPSASGGRGVAGGAGGLTADRTSEASINVPRFRTKPERSIWLVIKAKARSAKPLLASCSRNRQSVEWSGTSSVSESPRKCRNDSRSARASSSCGSESP